MAKTVGILALQGDFAAHERALDRLGAPSTLVRSAADLERIDGLILPGGESTTMLNLLHRENLFQPLKDFAQRKPVFGTCAGLILMANSVTGPVQESLGVMDVAVERNAYGRQIDSRVVTITPSRDLGVNGHGSSLEAVFIRAPIIRSTGPGVKVLATYQGDPVLVQQGSSLGASFHPELSDETRVHRLFLNQL